MQRFWKSPAGSASKLLTAMFSRPRRHMRIGTVALVLGAGVLAGPFSPVYTQPAPRITGLYSDLAFNEEGGDLLGMEVFLVAGPGGYYATVQCAGGEPAAPVVTRARVNGNRVGFTLPPGQPECGREFSGVISATGLRGRFTGETEQRWLRRKQSHWQ